MSAEGEWFKSMCEIYLIKIKMFEFEDEPDEKLIKISKNKNLKND